MRTLRSMRWAMTRRPAIRCTSTGRIYIGREPGGRRVRPVLRHAGGVHVRLRLRARQLSWLLQLLRDRGRRPRLLPVRRPVDRARWCAVRRVDRADGARAALDAGLREYRDEPGRRARRAGNSCRTSSIARARTTFPSARFISAPAIAAAALAATCSRGTATSFRTRARWSPNSARRASDSSPTSSRACSTIIRRTPRSPARGAFVHHARPECPASASSGTAWARMSISRIPQGVRWWQDGAARQVLDYGIDAAGTTTTNSRSGTTMAQSHGFGQPMPIERSRPLQRTADDARDLRSAGARMSRTSACSPSRAPALRASSAMRRRGRATTRRRGIRCAGTSGWD